MIQKLTVGPIEFSGGPVLAALAALLLLWPVIRQLPARGGSAELLGPKLQINGLEKRTEREFGIRLEELRADLEELRKRIPDSAEPAQVEQAVAKPPIDDRAFRSAIEEYRAHGDIADWRSRVDVDKRLIAGAGRLPFGYLEEALSESPDDQETAMAVAVSLGLVYAGEDDVPAAKLLVDLLSSPFQRVRYRASRSIERRGRRSDTSNSARRIMTDGVQQAARTERAQVILEALDDARRALLVFG